jgi:hypothetical protein
MCSARYLSVSVRSSVMAAVMATKRYALCAMRYALGDRGRRVAGGSAAERLHLIRRSARMFARIEVSHVCHLSEPPALAYRTIFR